MSVDSSNLSSSQSVPASSGSGHDGRNRKYPWTPGTAIVIVFVAIVAMPFCGALVLSFVPHLLGWTAAKGQDWLANSPLSNFLFTLLTEALTVALLYWFIRRKKGSFKELVGLGRLRWRYALYGIAGIVVYFGLFVLAVSVAQQFLHIDTNQQQALGFQRGVSGLGLAMAFLSLVILPPIAEEMLFRGFFYGTLRAYRMPIPLAILMTSTFFAFFHLFGGATTRFLWIAFLDTFILSLILCYLREKTGSIWSSMLVHALKNGFVFVNLFIITAR